MSEHLPHVVGRLKDRVAYEPVHPDVPGFKPELHKYLIGETNEKLTAAETGLNNPKLWQLTASLETGRGVERLDSQALKGLVGGTLKLTGNGLWWDPEAAAMAPAVQNEAYYGFIDNGFPTPHTFALDEPMPMLTDGNPLTGVYGTYGFSVKVKFPTTRLVSAVYVRTDCRYIDISAPGVPNILIGHGIPAASLGRDDAPGQIYVIPLNPVDCAEFSIAGHGDGMDGKHFHVFEIRVATGARADWFEVLGLPAEARLEGLDGWLSGHNLVGETPNQHYSTTGYQFAQNELGVMHTRPQTISERQDGADFITKATFSPMPGESWTYESDIGVDRLVSPVNVRMALARLTGDGRLRAESIQGAISDAPAVRDLLAGLTGTARLDATAIKNIPAPITDIGIRDSLAGLTGTARLDASAIQNLPAGGAGGGAMAALDIVAALDTLVDDERLGAWSVGYIAEQIDIPVLKTRLALPAIPPRREMHAAGATSSDEWRILTSSGAQVGLMAFGQIDTAGGGIGRIHLHCRPASGARNGNWGSWQIDYERYSVPGYRGAPDPMMKTPITITPITTLAGVDMRLGIMTPDNPDISGTRPSLTVYVKGLLNVPLYWYATIVEYGNIDNGADVGYLDPLAPNSNAVYQNCKALSVFPSSIHPDNGAKDGVSYWNSTATYTAGVEAPCTQLTFDSYTEFAPGGWLYITDLQNRMIPIAIGDRVYGKFIQSSSDLEHSPNVVLKATKVTLPVHGFKIHYNVTGASGGAGYGFRVSQVYEQRLTIPLA